ncbi:hypothetical protein GCM10010495_49240 [Kitasatospora herbaricolor]|uniref:hypothetical protein n=1 Tax=Kitasatospora herbaricolor TaxID=68217 RepID=UPI001749CD1D|nr:NADPH-dependent curcumin reductase CurA [Kitasatospora herbaricolor]GGV27288.1 hypothetical protein GCM10010495_49240 [Kitasatospora herbaricolor]
MTTPLPTTTREVRLAGVPGGLPRPEHFALVRTPLPTPGPGRVLVRNRYFLVFPGLLTLIGGEREGLPLPTLRPGDALIGPAVGEVVAAPSGSPLHIGDTVSHLLGWREYALVDAAGCTPPPRCGSAGPGAGASGIVGRRLAALDAEIDRLAGLRENLARRAAGED